MNCETVTDKLTLYLYDELDPGEQEALEEHAETCEACSERLRQERRFLKTLDQREEVPLTDAMLAESRHDLMRGVYRAERDRASGGGIFIGGWWDRLTSAFGPARLAWQPAAAVALLAAGFYIGRAGQPNPDAGGVSVSQASLIPLGSVVSDVQSVSLDPLRGNVEIVVEQITRRVISGSPSDPRIRSLLLSTVREYSNSGLRLDSLEVLTRSAADLEVRRALRETMLGDENPAARLRAIDALRPHKDDVEMHDALVEVLLRDRNPGMRVQAIELLTERPERELVGVCQALVETEQNNYVRLRCQRILRELNASIDHY